MTTRTILISGAGIAGPTLSYWLTRSGFDVTLVERSGGLRSSGSPVDVRGAAVTVAEQMGVMSRLRDAATSVTRLRFVNSAGKPTAQIDMSAMQRATSSREVEVPRGDLASVLFDAGCADAEVLFGDTITALEQHEHGVDVRFERAPARRFDLVIGADGVHSIVRRLAFGPESEFVRHLGLYVATVPLGELGGDGDEHTVVMYNTPGRATSIHPSSGSPLAAFLFRSSAIEGFDYRNTAQHRKLLAGAFGDGGWRVPELLQAVSAADDLYFDSLSQIRLSSWSRGRVALLGDAASCASLLGEGSSLAIAGAATLAEELATTADHTAAFRSYERRHRLLVDPIQRTVGQGARVMVPATGLGIAARNAVTKLWPLAVAAQRVRRQLSPGRPSAPATSAVSAASKGR